jgi:uncharacterized membrane protein
MKRRMNRLDVMDVWQHFRGIMPGARRKPTRSKFPFPGVTSATSKNSTRPLAVGMGLGAALMYLFDATLGNRRRARVRDTATHLMHKTEDALGKSARDLSNRAAGLAAEIENLAKAQEVENHVLEARAREAIGRVVSRPKAIDVAVDAGTVTLSGVILQHEVGRLLETVSRVRGVREVENELEVHKEPGDVPGLQGVSQRRAMKPELAQETWTPGVRLLTGLGGAALAAASFPLSGAPRVAGSVVGLGLLTRSVTNLPVKRITGIGTGRRAVDVQKAINIQAPVEEVFEFWRNFENFPRFMSNIHEVRDLGDGRSRWIVEGPAGISMQWNARITKLEPDHVIAWKSDQDSAVGNAGIVRFDPTSEGGTRVTVRMSYNPPAGAIGHAVATLFDSNPKQAMDEDLARLKSLLETGKTRADGQRVDRDELIH